MPAVAYDDGVFLNCPFDDGYAPLFRALVFTVVDCGFVPRCALEVTDSAEVRIAKIQRIIAECRFGVHDLSRTELDAGSGLPRFNMPLELGLFLGAREFGTGRQRRKRCLVMDRERYRYQVFCSDLAGQDVHAHRGEPRGAIEAVRELLATGRDDRVILPGPEAIGARYELFLDDLPELCRRVRLAPHELRFVELRTLAEEWVDVNAPGVPVYTPRLRLVPV